MTNPSKRPLNQRNLKAGGKDRLHPIDPARAELFRRIREQWDPASPPVSPDQVKAWIRFGRP